MPWTLEKSGMPASRITLPVLSGDVTVSEEQDTGIFRSVNGNVIVWQARTQPKTPTLPEMHFTDPNTLNMLRTLVTSGQVLVLTGEDGTQWRVRAINGFKPRLLGTPDRARKPKWRVSLDLVGVR